MDFAKILRENLENSTEPERSEFYSALRQKLKNTLEKNNISLNSDIAKSYFSDLDTAIRNHADEKDGRDEPARDVAAQSLPQTVTNPLGMTTTDQQSELRTFTETSPAPGSSGLFKSLALVLSGAVLAYGAGYFFTNQSSGSSTPFETHIQSETPRYEKNIAYLKAMETALKQYRQNTGRYPVSDSFSGISTVVKDISGFNAAKPAEGVSADRLYYKSDGRDFKLMYNRSGDCFIARIKNPELLDTGRASGPVDCQDYGVWSDGGKAF